MNTFTLVLVIILVLCLVWVGYGYIAVRGIEEPSYTVLKKTTHYEVRKYDSYIVAETRVTSNFDQSLTEGFRRIADYIFGNNTATTSIAMTVPVGEVVQKSESIAMTVPVHETGYGDEHTISFVMPSKYTLATIPKPNNPQVVLRSVPEHTVAVLSYSGFPGAERVEAKKNELLSLLQNDKVQVLGPARAAFYNPPWTPPFMLRNEILIDIEYSTPQ